MTETKEKLKPCPFCGRSGEKEGPKCSISGEWHCDYCCESDYDGMTIKWETAQNAWAHKQIEEANQRAETAEWKWNVYKKYFDDQRKFFQERGLTSVFLKELEELDEIIKKFKKGEK